MSDRTREWGDVASTTSLAHYLGRHANYHDDVLGVTFGPDGDDSTLRLYMKDGSEVMVKLTSNYSEKASG